ncbi:MAG: RDD family protein [Pseudomonadota bacterium]|nr:RDD family protein [Pseudomonadota bacterium]
MASETAVRSGLRRSFITPEGVDLQLELASAGARAGAFLIDAMFIMIVLVVATIILGLLAIGGGGEPIAVVWLIGFFILRNGWFILFEMGGRGATPGKRLMGLRVVARDGARLTGPAVMARNAMREIEVFLPLSFLGARAAEGTADTFLTIFSLLWSGIFLFFPLFNRDRLRLGDIIAGTWVVQTYKSKLSFDLVGSAPAARRTFSDAALNLYGIYELQTLEEVLRNEQPDAISTVARIIRQKAGMPDEGDDYGFLSDYYAALCTRLEAGLMVGRRRESKLEQLPGR